MRTVHGQTQNHLVVDASARKAHLLRRRISISQFISVRVRGDEMVVSLPCECVGATGSLTVNARKTDSTPEIDNPKLVRKTKGLKVGDASWM